MVSTKLPPLLRSASDVTTIDIEGINRKRSALTAARKRMQFEGHQRAWSTESATLIAYFARCIENASIGTTMPPKLNRLEREILIAIPSLWPDGDSFDLVAEHRDRESISYALQNLSAFGLITASEHDGVNPLAPYHRDVFLTADGISLQRELDRPALARFFSSEWRWLLTSTFTAVSLALSIWNFIHHR